MEAISAEGITKAYAGARVLAGATLRAEAGQRIVVFGPTGAGKTTLLLVLAGLVKADAGSVRLFGRQASGNGTFMPPEARSVGMVFQRALLWPHMTALGNVEFALYESGLARRERKRQALAAMALFGVEELEGRRPETLSGGQAQRVALARSVAARPRILLWDEPFTGLDAATRDEVAAAALGWMKDSAATLVAISHHDADAAALQADAVRMREGRLERA